jgi:hypothetical protein
LGGAAAPLAEAVYSRFAAGRRRDQGPRQMKKGRIAPALSRRLV